MAAFNEVANFLTLLNTCVSAHLALRRSEQTHLHIVVLCRGLIAGCGASPPSAGGVVASRAGGNGGLEDVDRVSCVALHGARQRGVGGDATRQRHYERGTNHLVD